ncbi:zinc transporter ZntB [Tropicibacter oceani]|uniref:Zinc transporter ZntB n=1 Tax=Tropicibacter oceani TaxID=3058420 RepID=A0ABY8QQ52_9RHOB|nr:zinc transporter ZntB [Tropicibacter oceani]WGW06033.1 zinc transporter ZntB [Tropicibacter oceani]
MADTTDTRFPAEDQGLVFACILDGDGAASPVDWPKVEAWSAGDGPLWVHLDLSEPRAQDWLRARGGMSHITSEALLTIDSRPRIFHGKRGFTTVLRGVNTNPGTEPEDMVALKIWSDGTRVVTVQDDRLMTPRDILERLLIGRDGPETPSDLYAQLIERLTERIGDTVETLETDLDGLELRLDDGNPADLRGTVTDMRRKLAWMRRYIAPQREALNALLVQPPAWLDELNRLRLREAADRTVHYIEAIDASREQTLVLKDEIANQLAEATNRTLYVLAIISGIFLPFGFLTGLFGINVGGMPGTQSPYAFAVFCAVLVALLVAEVILFRRLKWL